jgi:hypothetical protein
MRIDNEAGELRATLAPRGGGCNVIVPFLFAVAFVAVWCIGLGVLVYVVFAFTGRTPPAILAQYRERVPWQGEVTRTAVVAVALVWLFWTFFAIGIVTSVMRALFGADVVALGSDLSVTKRIGPFGRTRSFALQGVRAIALRRKDGALILRQDDGSAVELTDAGSFTERTQLRDLLRERLPARPDLGPVLTPYFEDSVQPDGTHVIRVSQQSRQKLVGCTTAIAAIWLAATLWHVYRDRQFSLGDPMVLVAALLIAGLWCVVKSEQSWQVKKGWFAYVRRFGPYRGRSEYDSANLSVEESHDSDGDLWFTLYVERDGRRENVHTAMNDPEDVTALGRFLARESGFPFYGLREQ